MEFVNCPAYIITQRAHPRQTCFWGHGLHDASSLGLELVLTSAVQLLRRRHGEEAGGTNLQVEFFPFIFSTLFVNVFTLTLIDYVKLSTHILSFSDNQHNLCSC